MHKIFSDLMNGVNFKGEVEKDSSSLLIFHGRAEVAKHCSKVAVEARRIADRFGININKAHMAGCLHDVSDVIPIDKRIYVCNELGIEVLQEECMVPSLLHSKISRMMASDMFGVKDIDILQAIECHSTLKDQAEEIDLILFIADKVSWDRIHNEDFI